MKVIIAKNYEEMSKKAANIMASQIILNPESVLGLATGSTPIRLYEELVRKYETEEISFEKITTFNLDEYIGLGSDHSQSYRCFMNQNLFDHVDIKEKNINIPNGLSENIEEECSNYEEKIKKAGGIDLQLLGIGRNGHIGFNEPNVKFEATTHRVKLDDDTIDANARFFEQEEVPREAISMGIKTIMHSEKILLVASGDSKAKAIEGLIHGAITPNLPASILQLHRDVTVIVDEAAGKLIK